MKPHPFHNVKSVPVRLVCIFYCFMFLLWELVVRVGLLKSPYLPAPSRIIGELISLLQNGTWCEYMSDTAIRFIIALLPASILGICMGWFFGLNRTLKLIIAPAFVTLYFVPKLWLVLPLFFLFGGSSFINVLPAMVLVFVFMAGSSLIGIENIDPVFFDIAKNYGVSRRDMVGKIVIPATLPYIYTNIQIVTLLALRVIVIFEVITQAPSGIGSFIWRGWQSARFEELWVGLFSAFALIVLFTLPIRLLRKRFIPWK